MARGVFPGDLEEAVVRAEPLQTGVPAAVHLSQQPGLQADTPGLDAHAERTGSERGFAQTAETVLEHEPLLTLRSFELITVISEKIVEELVFDRTVSLRAGSRAQIHDCVCALGGWTHLAGSGPGSESARCVPPLRRDVSKQTKKGTKTNKQRAAER